MRKVLSVVGVRPQFVKHGPVSRALRRRFHEIVVHTGQHYDHKLSRLFFDELGLPDPDRHLGVGSGSHAEQTGRVAERVEEVVQELRPDAVLVFGDTNSTLGAALAVAKLHVLMGHVEAGVRTGLLSNPEELNRILVDHASDLLFVPTTAGVEHLRHEGAHGEVHLVGDVMLDAVQMHLERAATRPHPASRLGLAPREYLLLTIHRSENTDDPDALAGILDGVTAINEPVVFPMHPRTREALARHGLSARLLALSHVHAIEPVGYLDMLVFERDARLVITDSGGIQKEAFFLGTPCITVFPRTPWPETVAAGWNRLVSAEGKAIADAVRATIIPGARATTASVAGPDPGKRDLGLYGDGRASERIADALARTLSSTG